MKPPETLADTLYRTSFNPKHTIGWRRNQLQDALHKAVRFKLDEDMSAFLGNLSTAPLIENWAHSSTIIDQMRVGSRIPYPTIWIEYNLRRSLGRSQQLLGQRYNPQESRALEGWLIERHPTIETLFRISVVSHSPGEMDAQGYDIWIFPFSYSWTTDDSPVPAIGGHFFEHGQIRHTLAGKELHISAIATGVPKYFSNKVGVTITSFLDKNPKWDVEKLMGLLVEWTGVMRRVWALLSTINDLPVLHREVVASKGFVARGRYRKFLSHKLVTLNVPIGKDLRKIAQHAVACARRRAHPVRGHWRMDWRNPGQASCSHVWTGERECVACKAKRMWIREHQRGDTSLGIVTHSYEVAHPAQPKSFENA